MTNKSKEQRNFGMKVTIRFNKLGRFRRKTVLRNVTEIHYCYPSSIIEGVGKKIAFESNVHATGVTYRLADIDEFCTELELRKAEYF